MIPAFSCAVLITRRICGFHRYCASKLSMVRRGEFFAKRFEVNRGQHIGNKLHSKSLLIYIYRKNSKVLASIVAAVAAC